MSLRVLAMACDDFACGRWRLIEPYTAIRDERVTTEWSLKTPETTAVFDVAVVQRLMFPEHVELMRLIKSARKKIIIDYDDAFPFTDSRLHDYHYCPPGSENARALQEAISFADALTVPTPQLMEHYCGMHPRVVLLPNAIDLANPIYTSGVCARVSEKTTIFWSGWSSHKANLRMVQPAIRRLLTEREDVVLALCGPPDLADAFDDQDLASKVAYVRPVPFNVAMRLASMADIAIAPLELTGFNDGKSEIRLIEAGAWGVPAVASPAAPYRRFEGGRGACLLTDGNDAESWYQQIKRLVNDPVLRRDVGLKARATVESRYNLQEVNRTRVELLCDL